MSILYLVSFCTLVVPLLFWTLTPNEFATPKEAIIFLTTIVALLTFLLHTLKRKQLSLPSPLAAIPLGIFFLTVTFSLAANPEGRPEALASKGLSLLSLPLLSLTLLSLPHPSLKRATESAIITSSTILSLYSLLSLIFLSRSPYLPDFMAQTTFTPTGSYSTTLIWIVIGAILGYFHVKSTTPKPRLRYLVSLAINTIAALVILTLMFPGGLLATTGVPLSASWSIALDALKSLRSLFFGIGLSNYSLLYASVKPLALNATSLWNTLPLSAGNELLTLLPTLGLLPTLAFVYLLFRTILLSVSTPYFFISLTLFLGYLLFPASSSLYYLTFLIYTLVTPSLSRNYLIQRTGLFSLTIPLVLLCTTGLYYESKNLLSEYYIRQAQQNLLVGDSQTVYNQHIRAIRLSPQITNYHLSFAELNFRLASALSQKPDLTEADRNTISSLVQTSIQSGKTAIALRPNDPRTWGTVGNIYQNLLGVADRADVFALEALGKAVSLDRANPNLRLEYATLISQIADLKSATESTALKTKAANEILLAIQLKPNFVNAYYNLARLYKNTNNLVGARQALEKALQYTPQDSSDYNTLKNELDNLAPTPSPVVE